jgi:hypothetical protein
MIIKNTATIAMGPSLIGALGGEAGGAGVEVVGEVVFIYFKSSWD